MSDAPEAIETTCPFCGQPMTFYWQNGVVSRPEYYLLGDFVAHSECFDKSYAEYEARKP